jgi:uncharacterized membrane protein YkoI
MIKLMLLLSAGLIAITVLSASPKAFALKGHRLSPKAKISLQQAQHIAQKAFHGKVVDEELEHERGGSGLRYSFDIRRGKTVHEVGVDAVMGTVLEDSTEGPKAD